ncbi:hypothetical protein [Nocardia sp. NPDC047038]|uniref:hypothetical protein n=1 Tax=Nocardia sp. NPDC047038 TaxID=3154338 RepID=UPI0033FF64F6
MSGDDADSTGRHSLRRALTAAGAIASQGAVIAAVLYYFGLVYTRAWYGYFGVDVGMLGLSTPDYVIGSLTSSYWPVTIVLLVVLACYALRSVPLAVAVRSRRPVATLRRWTMAILISGAILATVFALLVIVRDGLPPWLGSYMPIMLIAAVSLLGYAIALRETYPRIFSRPGAGRRRTQSTPWLPILALLGLGFLGFSWAVGSYAHQRAIRDARLTVETGFGARPVVLLLSVDRLAIEGGGSQVLPITTPGEKYRYAYSGLLLLARTTDRFFLIPHQWTKANHDRVFVISNNDNVRIDLAPHP